MTNNEILNRIRYMFDFDDSEMIAIFAEAECEITQKQLTNWLKKDDNPGFENCDDKKLQYFLNGLINRKRGKKEGPPPVIEQQINNNIIFRKLKIALNLQAEDVLGILNLADMHISKHELSAFFRRPLHKHYRECKDQILRNFLKGLQLKLRPSGSKFK